MPPVVLLAYLIFYSIVISLTHFDLMMLGLGEWVGWDNYREVLSDDRFWQLMKVNLICLVLPADLGLVVFAIAYLVNVEWGAWRHQGVFIILMVVAPVIAVASGR